MRLKFCFFSWKVSQKLFRVQDLILKNKKLKFDSSIIFVFRLSNFCFTEVVFQLSAIDLVPTVSFTTCVTIVVHDCFEPIVRT